jgi:hypothetical protein
MSATEIIRHIENLTREEQRELFARLQAHGIGMQPADGEPGEVSEDFIAIADQVFSTNAELFRKLAQ